MRPPYRFQDAFVHQSLRIERNVNYSGNGENAFARQE
jgi:hypothetical protein